MCTTNSDVVIAFDHVNKTYKLYKNEKLRLLGAFIKKVPYTEKRANKDVCFSINRGETVAVFGKNGAGKSTMLKLITQVIFPSSGNVIVNGRVSALLELTAGFDPEFTGRENIYFKGTLMGLSQEEVAKYEPAIIEFAELGPYIDQPVRTYSSGMKARLGFAVNISIEPEILIIDEALSVGDSAFRKKCKKKIDEVTSSKQVTVLLVTHSTAQAEEICKRGIVLKDGGIIFDGEISEAIKAYEKTLEKKKKKKPILAEKVKSDKPKAKAAKPKSDKPKPKAEKPKSDADKQKPETEKPKAEKPKSDAEQPKPEDTITKEPAAEALQQAAETKTE